MEASEFKWVNSISNIIGVNTLRLGGPHIRLEKFNIWHIMKKKLVLVVFLSVIFCKCYLIECYMLKIKKEQKIIYVF